MTPRLVARAAPPRSAGDVDPRARRLARKAKRQENGGQVILHGARDILLRHGPLAFTTPLLALLAGVFGVAYSPRFIRL